MEFPAAFRQHVGPRLAHRMRAGAALVACGIEDYSDVVRDTTREAMRFGASYLSRDVYADLEDWILTTTLREIDRAEAAMGPPPGQDIVEYCDRILAGIQRPAVRALIGHNLEQEHAEFATIQRARRRAVIHA